MVFWILSTFQIFRVFWILLTFQIFKLVLIVLRGKLRELGRKGLLEIIHTNICGPFTSAILGGYKYFITFIDHFSCYGYILLIQEKSEALVMFKFYKADIELKGEKEIKIVRSGRGGELYEIGRASCRERV